MFPTSARPTLRVAPLLELVVALLVALGLLAVPSRPAAAAGCRAQHTVQRGETLFSIGLKYNLTWDRLAAANGLANPNKIFAGQVLCIPAAAVATPPPAPVPPAGGSVTSVKALTDVNIRKGPGLNYGILAILRTGQTAQVTGRSPGGFWWRVRCPNGSVGECYVTALSKNTQPNTPTAVPPAPRPVPTPTFAISAVASDQSVTIVTTNFPANRSFDVRMGPFGTAGVNGTYVTTVSSGAGGSFTGTFAIPASLRGQSRIAIRLDGPNGYFAYNWFWNRAP